MKQSWLCLFVIISLWVCPILSAQIAADAQELLVPDPDPNPVMYRDTPPPAGSPQEVLINFMLYREGGEIDNAGTLLSKNMPEWKRTSCLQPGGTADNPLDTETLSYQVRSSSPESVKVNVSFNLKDKTHISWTAEIIFEDRTWRIK